MTGRFGRADACHVGVGSAGVPALTRFMATSRLLDVDLGRQTAAAAASVADQTTQDRPA
jgi:hypothetical protein